MRDENKKKKNNTLGEKRKVRYNGSFFPKMMIREREKKREREE